MLIQTGMQWVRACSHRMDQHLRHTLRELYQPLSRYPRFMRSFMEKRWSSRKRIPAIIEFHKHEESYSAGLKQLHERWFSGIVVCCAAGNAGPEPGTVTSPGRGPTTDGQIKPDLLVPDMDIVSLRAPSSTLDHQESQARVGADYLRRSGTSKDAPICSGVAALLLQRSPELQPDDVKHELLTAAENWGLSPNNQGHGYLDARDVNGLY